MINVLYVDDEEINLELFEISFKKDFNTFKALSAQQGLSILDNQDINVIVTDFKMPEMNGVEFIQKLKESKVNKKCILLTGYYENDLFKDPEINSLFFKSVMKPFKRDELKSFIIEASQ